MGCVAEFCQGLRVTSLENPCLHWQLKDFVALLEHLMLQSLVIYGQLSILEDKALHYVAVVDVNGEYFSQTDEDVVLDAVLGVYEWGQLLREVDGLVDAHLSSLLLVFLEQEGKGLDDLAPRRVVVVEFGAVFKHGVVLTQLGQEVVQRFHRSGPKHLVQDGNFSQQLARDFLEAARQLSYVGKGYLQVVPQVRELVDLQARDDGLDNHGIAILVDLVHNLVLAFEVDRAAHQDE